MKNHLLHAGLFALLPTLLLAACSGSQTPAPVLTLPPSAACESPSAGANLRVSFATGESNSPVIVWDGSLFRVAWWDLRLRESMVYLTRITETASRIGGEIKVFNEGNAKNVDMAHDGTTLTLVWDERGKVNLLDLGGRPYPAEILSESATGWAAGEAGAAAWVEGGALHFRAGPEGAKRTFLVAPTGAAQPRIAWSGDQYAVVWAQGSPGGTEIRLMRIGTNGKPQGAPVKVSVLRGQASRPVVVWNGEEYGVAWTHAAPPSENRKQRYQIYFARVASTGKMPISTRSLDFFGSADQVSLATSGAEYAVSWVGADQVGTAVYFQRLTRNGDPVGDMLQVNDGAAQVVGPPSMAWNGKGYGVAWHDDRVGGDSEIFFSFVACGEAPPPPADIAPPASDAGAPPAPPADAGVPAAT